MNICVCVRARVHNVRMKKQELQQGQKKGCLFTGNPKLFHWRERGTNMKKSIQWDLHVYVVCECRKYLWIVAAE